MKKKVLPAAHFFQYDSATWQGGRMCRSSSHTTGVEFLAKGRIQRNYRNGEFGRALTGQLDDLYLARVNEFGDTTETAAQMSALKSYGIRAEYKQSYTLDEIIDNIDKGLLTATGILHKGHISHPTGGGHWVMPVGYEGDYMVVHDPAGELDLINGGYDNSKSGKYIKYTKKNFQRRFEVATDGSGRFVPGSGWGTVFLGLLT